MPDPTPTPPQSCSVVIRANNEEKHLERLLQGIAEQTLPEVEVILVDSGSTDGTLEIAERWKGEFEAHNRTQGARRGLEIVHIAPESFTFGYALNQGIERATQALAVIASAHVYPMYPDWLERLLAPFAEAQIGLTYGKQRGSPDSHFAEGQIFQHWYPDRSQPRQPYPFCNNANAAIRRALWEAQRYDETLPGLEDLDWGRRLMEKGYAISYVAEAEIIHVHNESPQRVYNRYRREAMAFKRIFPEEHFHWWDVLRHFSTNALSDLAHAARQGQLAAHLGDIVWFRWMQFSGTYQGYRQSGPLTWQLRQTFYYPRGIGAAAQPPNRSIEPIRYNEHITQTHPQDKP